MKKIIIFVNVILIVLLTMSLFKSTKSVVHASSKTYEGSIYEQSGSRRGYDEFLSFHKQAQKPAQTTTVDLFTYHYENGLVVDDTPYISNFTDDNDITKEGIYIPETGDITFSVDVVEAGLYQIEVEYYSIKGRNASINKGIKINDEFQFLEAENFTLLRFYADEYLVSEKRQEKKNDIRPKQIEKHLWNNDTIKDRVGYYNGETYYFYFIEGINTITFESIREPIVLSQIKLFQEIITDTYQNYLEKHLNQNAKYVEDLSIIEAEEAYLKSGPSLTPIAEYQTYKYEPYVRFITRYNAIGGYNWRVAGDEITWQINVSTPGLYQLTFKVMQNFSRGMNSTRRLSVNGELPFTEASQIEIPYSNDLQYVTIGETKNPYYIYLNEGINEITLQANIGVYGNSVKRVNQVIYDLRKIYREIVMRIGLNPDPIQDYRLFKTITDLKNRLIETKEELESIKEEIIAISNSRSGLVSSFDRTIYQIDKFISDEKNIQKGLVEFEQNISSLGTWVIDVSEQPLTIDQVIIHGKDAKLKRAKTNFFEKIWHEFILFLGSFNTQGDFGSSITTDGPTIEVWIGTGRDQANILRQLIDESFVTQQGINVNLKMVNMNVLLSASLSGNGPDVAIGVDQKLPVNWGIRGGIYELTSFSDFDSVKNRYSTSALTPLSFNGLTYGLPDTEDFLVTFYREDILKDIGVEEIPKTWDEVIDISPVLQKQFFEFYLPVTQGTMSPVLYSMIVQNGGQLYLNEGAESGLLTPESLDAFMNFTKLFSDYGFVLEANFVNRFRSGQMPIGVTYFSTYNTLSVYAPEISGQWRYGLIPGILKENEYIQSSASSITASVIMGKTKYPKESWEFLKWWLSADIQTSYANSMEAVLGAAARYPTANLEAFSNLAWPARDYIMLEKQRDLAVGIPTVPGDYIVGRHIDNAFRSTINTKVTANDSIYNYTLKINEELRRKREELGIK